MLDIIEIIQPAIQGKSMPYLCGGEDGQLYYVKGIKATRKGQICEWICANLAYEFGLPIAPYQLVNIPKMIYQESSMGEAELGNGPAFATQKIDYACWYQTAYLDKTGVKLKNDVLAFDWWIKNMDRMQDNPNLLWRNDKSELTIIDHDSAFGFEFLPSIFFREHIFSSSHENVFRDLVSQATYSEKMQKILMGWQRIIEDIPPNWLEEAKNEEIPFHLEKSFNILNSCTNENFWST